MTTIARSSPQGIRLKDGFSTRIAFALDPDISFWEVDVTPPGLDGGDAIDYTTMHNTTYRTMAPRQLKTLTDAASTAAYDPAVFTQILAIVNVNGWITIHYPDGSTLDFVGYLRTFEPGACAEGEQPTATINITPTNQILGVETAPVLTSVAGT